jgi:Domain of unknown function (DUF4188)
MGIVPGPQTTNGEDEIVLFLVGMTFNRPWKIRSWWPVFTAMPRMLAELARDPDSGLLASRLTFGRRGPTVIQYWRSIEDLDRFARGKGTAHTKAWSAFMKSAASKGTDVGLWHETYRTQPGLRENLYVATGPLGFSEAVPGLHPVGPAERTASGRFSEPTT